MFHQYNQNKVYLEDKCPGDWGYTLRWINNKKTAKAHVNTSISIAVVFRKSQNKSYMLKQKCAGIMLTLTTQFITKSYHLLSLL